MQEKKFTQKIIEWYHENKRLLPWRETNDPFRIWLSEIILQQTRVAQGIPYYLKFISRFPDVQHLAAADEQEILRLWQGLGYYTRARNLHRCAKVIVANFGGHFPNSFETLLTLPGIGSYTAAAIASISFREPVAVVDGNVFRVLSRVFGIELDIALPETKPYFFALANSLIPNDRPDDFNQAIMEFGATWCLPKNPKCDDCTFKSSCYAFAHEAQALLPVKSKKAKARTRYLNYLVILHGKKIAMRRRSEKDIWNGLFDFYVIEANHPLSSQEVIVESRKSLKIPGTAKIDAVSRQYRHLLSHQTILATFTAVRFPPKSTLLSVDGKKIKLYSPAEINDLPKPVLVSRYLSDCGIL